MLKIIFMAVMILIIFPQITQAKSVRTPEGNFPRVQWAVVESTPGNLGKISEIGARVLAKTSASESGTYALYGVVEKNNPDLMRLLEIYESHEAYRIHTSSPAFVQYVAERYPILKNLKVLPAVAVVLEQKDSGVGKFVITSRYEVKPENLAEFEKIISDEAIRAVKDDSKVLGFFVTYEQEKPNMIHTMEIFSDESGYKNYIASQNYKNIFQKLQPMILAEKNVDYLSANITLTQKGKRF